jgi:chromosome segregation ATPase
VPFTIEEFHDLVRLLEQHPEWSVELRRLVLSQELLTLPELVKALAEAQRRTEEQVRALAEAQGRTEEQVRALAEAQRRTEERLEELDRRIAALAEAQRRTEERLEELERRVTALAEAQGRTEEQVRALAEAQRRTEERLEELERRVTALAEAQRRTEERLEALAEAQRRTEERLEALAEAQRRTEEQVRALAEAQRRTEERLEELGVAVSKLRQDVDSLLGSDLERRYRERAAGYFQRLLRRIKLVDHQALALQLDKAVDAGTITQEEKEEILLLDAVVQGRRDRREAYLAVEVSLTVSAEDVQRAASRAALLRKVTRRPVFGAVAGRQLDTVAAEEAAKRSVACLLNGRVVVAP